MSVETQPGTRAPLDRIDALLAALFGVAGLALAMNLALAQPVPGQPLLEDEFVYLLQAKMLAAGHLSYPSPPLPEFFEAAHVLVVPRYTPKYLPGHAALLVPFLAAPWLGPCVFLGITAALIYLAARLAGLARWSAALAAALLLLNTSVLEFFATTLSQTSSMMAVAAATLAAIAVHQKPRPARVAALFSCAVAAALIRPFTGGAVAAAGCAILALRRDAIDRRTLAAAILPLVGGALLTSAICRQMTGSWTTTPWSLYARQYMPFDGPGIGAVSDPPPLRGLPPHLVGLHDGFLRMRQQHTLANLPHALLTRLTSVASLAPTGLAIPFVALGMFWPPLWGATLIAAAYFLLQLSFHAGWMTYHLEMTPWYLLAAAAGAELAVRAVLQARRRAVAMAGTIALTLVALLAGASVLPQAAAAVAHPPQRDMAYAYWEPAFAWLRERHALVFVHYPPDWNFNFDLTYNEPDLARAQLVRAIDKGARDRELLEYFPDRPAFVLDAQSLHIEPLR